MSPHIFLVAGEESGDRLGAALIAAIRRRTQAHAQFSCVGGAHMAAEGVPSFFPLGDLAIIGFSAIPASLPKISGAFARPPMRLSPQTRCAGHYRQS
jgi:lipid-A-disaccharide synthase